MNSHSTTYLLKACVLGFLIILISTPALIGQSKVDQIDALLSKYNEYGQFNGSALVAENGEVILKKGFGLANMEWNIPNDADTKHRLGSITKQFTAMLIIQLVEAGKLSLDEPISTYLPDYPKSNGDLITVHHLLTHTSGTPNYTSFPGFFNDKSRDPLSPTEFIKLFEDMPLEFSPGEQFAYSNSGYFLLGVIIEKVTGKTYEQVLRESILEPLQMTNTGYDHHDVVLENRAAGYAKNGNEYVNAPYLDMSLPYAAGSMYSTVEDLYLWDQALYTNQLASEKAMDLIFTGHVAAGPTQYGYGWGISQTTIGGSGDPKTIIGHGGGIPGFNTNISRVPADKHLIVLFNNTGGAALNDMTAAIRNILYDQPYDMPKMSLATSLSNIILKKGIDKGLVFYEKYKDSENYSLKENEMNNAGYQFLQTGKVKEAIAVFQLNVEAFPSSGNVYDSLGEAYLEDGNKELAIKNYQKSIEIDPGNTNGIDMLKKIQSN